VVLTVRVAAVGPSLVERPAREGQRSGTLESFFGTIICAELLHSPWTHLPKSSRTAQLHGGREVWVE
jgi:hypothetical protein